MQRARERALIEDVEEQEVSWNEKSPSTGSDPFGQYRTPNATILSYQAREAANG